MQRSVDRPDAARHFASLREQGYAIIPSAIDVAALAAIEADVAPRLSAVPFGRGEIAGWQTRRLGGVLKHAAGTRALVMAPMVLDVATRLLGPGCDCLQLNAAEALELAPGERAQPPHREAAMWPHYAGEVEPALSVLWPLPGNPIALDVWPEPGKAKVERLAAHPGSAVLLSASAVRAIAANDSPREQRCIVVGYCLGWLKPYENQWLTYPPEVAIQFDADLAALVGYRRERPNLGAVGGACPSRLLSGIGYDAGAEDVLFDEQATAAAAFREIDNAAGDWE